MKKNMNKLLIYLGSIIVLIILVLGYLGFVPILSSLMGASSPRDLGVRPTAADYASASAKLGRTLSPLAANLPVGSSVRYTGSHPVDIELSSEEFTATRQHGIYEYSPSGRNTQVKFDDDGTVEISGVMIRKNIAPWGKAFNIGNTQEFSDKIKIFQADPAFYLKGKITITNNVPSIDLEQAQMGKVPVPVASVPKDFLDNVVSDTIDAVPGLKVDSLTVENGKMHFKGTYPDKIEMASNGK